MKIDRNTYINIPKRIGDVTGEPTGFPNRTDSQFSFDDGTLTFTIEPTGTSFDFYSLGKKFNKTAAETVVITDTEGLWFIYYNSSGTLTASQTVWGFSDGSVFIALLYWDSTNNTAAGIGEERHGLVIDSATHQYLHINFGAQWESGFTPVVTVDGDGSLDSHAEIQSISAGIIWDEDIEHSSLQLTAYEIWYKDGASAAWRKTASSAAAVAITTSRPDWNEFTAGAWQRTEVTNNDFILTHIFATNSTANGKIILIMGEAEYATKKDAQDGAAVEITTLTTGVLPTAEFHPIATLIIQCRDAYTNTYNARIISTSDGGDFIDFRESEKTGVGAAPTDHGNLNGLADDDHIQYLLVDGTRALTGAWDMGSQILTNVNIDSGTVDNITSLTVVNDVDIGNFDMTMKGLNLSEDIIMTGSRNIIADTGLNLVVNSKSVNWDGNKWYPQASLQDDLGGSSNLWENLYLSGTMFDNGGNSITIANIAGHITSTANPHSVTAAQLSLVIGTDVQAWDAGLDSLAALTYVSDSFIKVTAEDTYAIRTLTETKTDLSLNNVTNVATDDTAYNEASWNANTDAATKNAIRDQVETMLTAIGLNTTHRGSDGSDHSFLDQDVTANSSPAFDGTNITGIDISAGTNLTASEGTTLSGDDIQLDFNNVIGLTPSDADLIMMFDDSESAHRVVTWMSFEGALEHQKISGAGTKDHAAIDLHIGETNNPHSVTAAQVGNTTAQWNAIKISDEDVDAGISSSGGNILVYNSNDAFWCSLPGQPIEMTTGEDITANDIVYISGNNLVRAVTGSTQAIMGVALATVLNGNFIQIQNTGRATVTCSGTVTAGDLLIGAATGKVAKFTPTTSKTSGGGTAHKHTMDAVASHTHPISDGGATGDSNTLSGGGHTPASQNESAHTHDNTITSGEYAGAKIIGKALTGGTNTTIDIMIIIAG